MCAAALSAEPAPKPQEPKTFAQTACDGKGSGLLLRYGGKDSGAFEREAQESYGLEPVEPAAEAAGEKGKPKAAPKVAAPKGSSRVYRLPPGDACQGRLDRLRGGGKDSDPALADDLQVVAAPDSPPKTREALEKAFAGAGTLSKLSRMSFKSPGDLSALFDKAKSLGDFQKAQDRALKSGAVTLAPEAGGSGGVKAEVGAKPDPTGTQYPAPAQRPKLPSQPVPDPHETETEPPRAYSSNPIVRTYQRASDWAGEAVSNAADRSRFTFDRLTGSAPVDPASPVRTVGGWAQLPGAGPGFRFVGAGQYGTPRLVADLMAAAADPIANVPGEKPMAIVAISRYGGGYFPPHITHQNGTDVDVALSGYRDGPLDAKALDRNLLFAVSVVEHMKPTFILLDARRQAELQSRAQVLMSQPGLDPAIQARIKAAYPLLFVGTPAPRGKKLFSHVERHYDHFHIREQAGQIGQ